MTNPDEITWAARELTKENDVCWSAERVIVVAVVASGAGNRVMTRPDGITWTTRTSGAGDDGESLLLLLLEQEIE